MEDLADLPTQDLDALRDVFDYRAIRRPGQSDCCAWAGATTNAGLNLVMLNDRQWSTAEEVALLVAYGRHVDDGEKVTTTCGTNRCVNPQHLRAILA